MPILYRQRVVMYFDIKAVPFKYCTPNISGVDCCASLPKSRGDSFSVLCIISYTQIETLKEVLKIVSL